MKKRKKSKDKIKEDTKNVSETEDQKEDDTEKSNDPEQEIEEDKNLPKKTIEIENKQIFWVSFFIVLAFLAFLIPFFYVQNERVFDYNGVTWQIEKDAEITFYHTFFEKRIKNTSFGFHNTFLRNDPRENNVPIEINGLRFHRKMILSQDEEVLQCDKQILITDAIKQITLAMPNYDKQVIAATSDKELADNSELTFNDCSNKPEKSTLILIQMGEETKITHEEENKCYKITLKDCSDNFLAAEKFILEIIKELNPPRV